MKKRILAMIMSMTLCFGFHVSDVQAAEHPEEVVQEYATLYGSSMKDSTCIFVSAVGIPNTYDAEVAVESGGVTLFSYETSGDAERAKRALEKDGYCVSGDPVLELDASGYTFSPDALGQYGKTVQESTHTNTMTLAPELMGLTAGARNIVDAQLTTTVKPVGVAVIDSGIDTSSGYLIGRVSSGYNVVDANSRTSDEYGHGTFIASIIANNTPSNVSIVPIKITDSTGAFTASRLSAALQYLVNNSSGINVVNLSLSACTLDATQMDQVQAFIDPYIDALYAKGIVVVTSAGNKDGRYPSMTANDSYPANYEKCLAVGALGYGSSGWSIYSQSLQGSCIDFWAPGKLIRGAKAGTMNMYQATAANGWNGEWLDLGDGTCLMSGTSQATAFVTSALSQILSYDTSLPSDNQISLLRMNAANGSGGLYPEMSGYFYAVGSYNSSTGGYSGLVSDWDVSANTDAGTITLVKYTGNSDSVNIPASYTVNGRELKTVLGRSTSSSGPFANNGTIKTVTIADGVSVDNNDASYMFYGCNNLKSVNKIPVDVLDTSHMFYGCSSLLQYPTVPAKVTRMDHMFYGCSLASGTSKIESAVISSAKDAYKGDSATIDAPLNTVTFETLRGLIAGWNGVLLNGASSEATEGNVNKNEDKNVGINQGNGTGNTGTNTGENTTGNATENKSEQTGTTTSGTENQLPEGHKVTFYYRNVNVNQVSGGKVKTVQSDSHGFVLKPKNPTKSGYYFAGWYLKEGDSLKKFSFSDTQITKDTKLYAKWISKKIGATSIKSLKKIGNKVFWISYGKASNATHYQIQVSNHKNFQSGPIIRTKSTSKEVTLLMNGKKYVRVRGCRKLGGKWYYGKWTVVKTVKV